MDPQLLANEEIQAWGNRFARTLDRAGIDRRAHVGVLLPNVPEFLAVLRGCAWSGRILTPLSWRWTPEDVAYVVGDASIDALIVHQRFAEAALGARDLVPPDGRFVVGGDLEGFRPWSDVASADDAELAEPIAGDSMLYTSGTTGRPKGVQRSVAPDGPPPSRVGASGAAMLRAYLGETAGDSTHLVAAPLYHAGPSTYGEGAALLGADLVLLDGWDAETCLAAIERYKVTSTFMVPTQFVRLLQLPDDVRAKYDTSSLRLVAHGAAPVAPDIKRAMIDWWGPVLFEFYGGTEGGGTTISSAEWLERPGSVGRPLPGYDLRILDDGGADCAVGTEGGVYFLADAPFEYRGDADKTSEGRQGDWFTLGDIGYLDQDGYLFLCDRRADVINSGGMNIYPAQIEAVLVSHPSVVDCCVVGVPDAEWGEAVHAIIEFGVGADQPDDGDLAEWCRSRLAGYQRPKTWERRGSLPRTETGKLARRLLRDPFWADLPRKI